MKKNDLSVFEMEKDGFRLRLQKGLGDEPIVTSTTGPAAANAPGATASAERASTKDIVSPMVGTFFRAASPDASPFVDVGTKVDEDTVVCIIDAIHPGYGFLAENAHFAEVVESCKIKFIGPPSDVIQKMGDKDMARACARKAGVPITPGSDGVVQTDKDAVKLARKLGYPVMIKAVAGGGGRGMRAAHNETSLVAGFHSARLEAEKAFGTPEVYIEKLIVNPHHIEFQIVADSHGRVVHLGERDCSIQRRNQKVIEECPSPLMTPSLRKKMGSAAIKLAKSVGYENAGTIEFLVDQDRRFYFMEMNTRIQVEHTITEEVYACDLVKEQIRIAAGQPLSPHVAHAVPRLHAIECRVNAEDPANNFQASPGRIAFYYAPGGRGVRIDSHAYTGYVVPPFYDSLIGKIITVGTRRDAPIDGLW